MPPTSEVLLYVPNLIGYARLACIIYGFHAPGVFDSAVRTHLATQEFRARCAPCVTNCWLGPKPRSPSHLNGIWLEILRIRSGFR